jgi:hypothetical protein
MAVETEHAHEVCALVSTFGVVRATYFDDEIQGVKFLQNC